MKFLLFKFPIIFIVGGIYVALYMYISGNYLKQSVCKNAETPQSVEDIHQQNDHYQLKQKQRQKKRYYLRQKKRQKRNRKQRQKEVNKKQQQNQCVIPVLDPYSAEIFPYINYNSYGQKCTYTKISRLVGNILYVNLTEEIAEAGYYYVRRIDDFKNVLSERFDIRSAIPLKKGVCGCLQTLTHNNIAQPYDQYGHRVLNVTHFNETINLDVGSGSDGNKCDDNKILEFAEDGRIYHKISGGCLYLERGQRMKIILDSSICKHSSLTRFTIVDQHYFLQPVTLLCVKYNSKDGSLRLANCEEKSKFILMKMPFNEGDKSFKITEELVKVEYTKTNGYVIPEFHVYMKNRTNNFESKIENDGNYEKNYKSKEEDTKKNLGNNTDNTDDTNITDNTDLNIVLVMVDSLSNANAQRQLKKTYSYLEKDPDSVIMKGHTINGDGTTIQLTAMLTGRYENELPEARRGFNNSDFIDNWPFIFKDYENEGYKTFYSEDDPFNGAFQYRLKGFRYPPTFKYLRPFWMVTEYLYYWKEKKCTHQMGFEHLKNFLTTFKRDKTFSLLEFSYISHMNHNHNHLIDDDVIDLFIYLKNEKLRENTIVILFGDHGQRIGSIRSTTQGYIEERLPMMSVSLPAWFKTKYPEFFKNLQDNSEILTSHFDIYATLKHLLHFPELKYKHRFAKSLFTDIYSLNRACKDAGIPIHYCPCTNFKEVDKTSEHANVIAYQAIEIINEMVSMSKDVTNKCSKLKLQKILRLRKTQGEEETLYDVAFSVSPSEGEFEATVRYNLHTKKYTVDKDISRINVYGHQSECVAKQHPHLRKYCYCK